MQSIELRRRVQIGFKKGEARNSLARAVFLNRLGEIRDRRLENQRYRAGGLNLVVAATHRGDNSDCVASIQRMPWQLRASPGKTETLFLQKTTVT